MIELRASAVVSRRDGNFWRARTARLLRSAYLSALEQLDIELLLEVGAHRAETSIEFVRRCGGRAVAFEANPHTFEAVTKAASVQGVDVRCVAVSDIPGTTRLRIPLWADRGLTPGNASLLRRVDSMEYFEVEVPVTTIDDVTQALGPPGRSALWIDVEGIALQVLRGSEKLFSSRSCVLVMVELESRPYWEGQATASEVNGCLRDQGFTPVLRDAQFPEQFNVVYVAKHAEMDLLPLTQHYWRALARLQHSNGIRWLASRLKARTRSLVGGGSSRR